MIRSRVGSWVMTIVASFSAACGGPRQGPDAPAPADDGGVDASRSTSNAQIVFTAPVAPTGSDAAATVQEVFTMNLDGSNRVPITNDGTNKFLPHFSPDGTLLVYTRFSTGGYGTPNAKADVAVYDLATSRERRLTTDGKGFQPVWSPDGKRIAYDTFGTSVWILDADGSNAHELGAPTGAADDKVWGDLAWSSDDWILFTVAQAVDGCFKVRIDKIRPDGTDRTRVTDGGPSCTPSGMEQAGDADPGFSPDGKTIYSSRGFAESAPGFPGQTERKLYAFSSDATSPGKEERDLSLPSAPDCIEGVPKASPDGARILLFRACKGERAGITLTDQAGSYRKFITDGFGPDWKPVAK